MEQPWTRVRVSAPPRTIRSVRDRHHSRINGSWQAVPYARGRTSEPTPASVVPACRPTASLAYPFHRRNRIASRAVRNAPFRNDHRIRPPRQAWRACRACGGRPAVRTVRFRDLSLPASLSEPFSRSQGAGESLRTRVHPEERASADGTVSGAGGTPGQPDGTGSPYPGSAAGQVSSAEVLTATRTECATPLNETGACARGPVHGRPGGLPACGGPARDRVVCGVPHRTLPPLRIDAQLKVQALPVEHAEALPAVRSRTRWGRHLPPMGRSGRFDGTASRRAATRTRSPWKVLINVSRASNAVGPTAAVAGVLAVHTRHLQDYPHRPRQSRGHLLFLSPYPVRPERGQARAWHRVPDRNGILMLAGATRMTTNHSTPMPSTTGSGQVWRLRPQPQLPALPAGRRCRGCSTASRSRRPPSRATCGPSGGSAQSCST